MRNAVHSRYSEMGKKKSVLKPLPDGMVNMREPAPFVALLMIYTPPERYILRVPQLFREDRGEYDTSIVSNCWMVITNGMAVNFRSGLP